VLKDLGYRVHFHATLSNPKGRIDPRLPGLADLDNSLKNDGERPAKAFRPFDSVSHAVWSTNKLGLE
jgi:hypothetical protein